MKNPKHPGGSMVEERGIPCSKALLIAEKSAGALFDELQRSPLPIDEFGSDEVGPGRIDRATFVGRMTPTFLAIVNEIVPIMPDLR